MLGHRLATKPPLVIETSSEGVYDTGGVSHDSDTPVETQVDEHETSDTVSIAATDMSSTLTDMSSEEKGA